MPKRTPRKIIDTRTRNSATTISGITLTSPSGVSDHGLLLGLGDDDHSQYLLASGGRTLTGNLAASAGVTIDGIDISAHAANPDAHHATATAGNSAISVAGQAISLAAAAAGAGLSYAAGVLAVGAGSGLTVNADDVALTTPGALSVATSSSAAGNHTHAITSSSNPGAAASILASDASGYVSLVRLSTSDRLRSPILDTAAGNLTVQPAGDVMLDPAGGEVRLAANRTLQSDNYASQTTGMRVTYAGEGDFRYLFTDELHAKSFIADLEQALAGGQIISKSVAVLASTFTVPAAGAAATLVVRDLPSAPDMAVFQSGDYVGLRQFSRAAGSLTIGWAWGTVTGYADQSDGTQTWTFTRHATTPGAASGTIAAESLVLDFGTSGNGFYEVNAIDGAYAQNSPYWRIATWADHPATQTVRVQGGNLRGLFGVANEFGLYAGDGTATTSTYIRLSNAASSIQNVPLSLYESGTAYLSLNANSGIQIVPDAYDGSGNWMTENRAITFHSALPGTDANYLGGVGCALDSTNLNIAMQAVDVGNRQTTAMIAAANSSAFGFLNIVSTSIESYVTLFADQISLETPDLSTFYSGNRYTIWHAGNDGAGSTLDADLLDGNHGANFAMLSGASFSGDLYKTVTESGLTSGRRIGLLTSGALATATDNDRMLLWHVADNEMAIGVGDDYAWRTLVLQPYGGTVDVRAYLLASNVGYDWSDLTPGGGWNNYGSGNATFGIKRFGNLVSIKGVLSASGTIASDTSIYTLASEYRPAATRQFICYGSPGAVRVLIASDGTIRPQAAFSSGNYLSVEITYFTGG